MGERRMVRTQERGEKGGRSDRKWGERKGEGGERREGQKRKGERGMGEGRAARICWAVATAVAARRPHSAATRAATDRLVRGDSESGDHDGHAGNGFIIRAPACSFSFVWRWVRMN
jgi:hypothetical protein